jgi:predicted Zn-dependent protease with MMP-like domain
MPRKFRKVLDTITLLIEDEPSDEILDELRIPRRDRPPRRPSDLCGFHSGVPLPDRSFFDTSPRMDRIYLFRGPILRLDEPLEEEIEITLFHELGHHFGWDEDHLHELGYG